MGLGEGEGWDKRENDEMVSNKWVNDGWKWFRGGSIM